MTPLALPVPGRRAAMARWDAALDSMSWRVPVMLVLLSRWMTVLGLIRIRPVPSVAVELPELAPAE